MFFMALVKGNTQISYLFLCWQITSYLCVNIIAIWLLSTTMVITNLLWTISFFSSKFQKFWTEKAILCHRYHTSKHGAVPQGRGSYKTQLHCPFKPSVSHCVHLQQLGEQTRVLFCELREQTTFFFSFTRVSWTREKGISLWVPFVLSCSTFSKHAWVTFATPPVSSTFAHIIYRIDIWDTALQSAGWRFLDEINRRAHRHGEAHMVEKQGRTGETPICTMGLLFICMHIHSLGWCSDLPCRKKIYTMNV